MRRIHSDDKKVCYACGSDKTGTRIIKRWQYPIWAYNRDYNNNIIGFLCHKCNMKFISNPKRNGVYRKNVLNYKDKMIDFPFNPRKGVCSWCGRKVGKDIRRTNLHHFAQYHDDDPLKDTVEICISCHSYENWRLGLHANRKPIPRDTITGRFIRL